MARWARWMLLLIWSVGILAGAGRASAACQNTIGENATIDSSWFASCVSEHNRGSYAEYYTFTLTKASTIQIDLVSNVDGYLYLLAGNLPTNNYIAYDNNSGGNSNARIARTLVPGTYTIEATTYNSATTGSFRLSVRTDGGADCRKVVPSNANESGAWSDACVSVHSRGSFARYYTFTLTQSSVVQIDLVSNTNSYLYLLAGDNVGNNYIAYDNNSGGNLNARISRSLIAGTYTIEATTDDQQQTGAFQLSLRTDGGGPGCRLLITPNATQSQAWTNTCISVHNRGSYARYYTFTLTAPVNVQINLVSNADSYLYLLAGDNVGNNYIAYDNNSGGNFNARINRALVAGTYTIEATTSEVGIAAPFTLSLRSDGGGASCRAVLKSGTTARGNWTAACTSVHNPGANARYYTFTLAKATKVQIDLKSAAADSYLYLLTGGAASGNYIAYDNNSGGKKDARIARTLPAGTYTIEATTYDAGRTGAFTVVWKTNKSAAGEP